MSGMNYDEYCQEVFHSIRRAFFRRGFTWISDLSSIGIPCQVRYQAELYLQDKKVGSFKLSFRRYSRKKRKADGSQVGTHHPVRNSLNLQVFDLEGNEIAKKSSGFLRDIPGIPVRPMFHPNGDRAGGRPKVRRWATYASQALMVTYVNKQAEFIHEQ